MLFRKVVSSLSVMAVGLAFAGQCLGATILFNFEEQAAGTFPTVVSSQGGVTATLAPNGGSSIDVTDPGPPPSWGTRSLISFFSGGNGFVITFSVAVNAASMEFGDFNADAETGNIFAFSGANGTGSLLGSNSTFYSGTMNIANGDSNVGSVSVAAPGIRSIIVTTTGTFPGSVYWDNLRVQTTDAVPEPATLALFGASVFGLGFIGWRRRKAAR
jgi:hypothetical protein